MPLHQFSPSTILLTVIKSYKKQCAEADFLQTFSLAKHVSTKHLSTYLHLLLSKEDISLLLNLSMCLNVLLNWCLISLVSELRTKRSPSQQGFPCSLLGGPFGLFLIFQSFQTGFFTGGENWLFEDFIRTISFCPPPELSYLVHGTLWGLYNSISFANLIK